MRAHSHFSTGVINLALVLILGLSACLPAAAAPTPTPTILPTATQTVTPQPSPTASLTPTPSASPTQTATATSTSFPVGSLLLHQETVSGSSQIFLLDLDYGTHLQLTEGSGDMSNPGWTPDGRQILYQADYNRNAEIHLMDWNGKNDRNLSGDGSPYDNVPVISPDGAQIAFFARYGGHWALYLMDLNGKNQRAITENTVYESEVSWSPDSAKLVFTPWHNTQSPPFIGGVNADGTNYRELTQRKEYDSDPKYSPDGSRIAFTCVVEKQPQICSMKPDGSDRRTLTQKPGGNDYPAWSPDGKQMVFVSWRDSAAPNSCEDGDCNFEIYVMNADGSNQHRLTNHPAEDWNPSWSPDGKKIAFVSLRDETRKPKDCGDTCNSEIYVMAVDGKNPTRLTNNTSPDWNPRWRPLASPSPKSTVTPTIKATPARIGGGKNQISYWAQSNWTPQDMGDRIYLIGLDGSSENGAIIANGKSATWSPDGNRAAFVRDTGESQSEIFLMDADGKNEKQLTHSKGQADEPAWSPDGQKIAYSLGHKEIHLVGVDGNNDRLVVAGNFDYYAPAWSGDGSQLAFMMSRGGLGATLVIVNQDGTNFHEVVDDADWSSPPSWSPDNQWIAYGCVVKYSQICVMRPNGKEKKVLTQTGQSGNPSWSPDGKWLAFISVGKGNQWQVYVMKPDGSELRQITNDHLDDFGVAWRP